MLALVTVSGNVEKSGRHVCHIHLIAVSEADAAIALSEMFANAAKALHTIQGERLSLQGSPFMARVDVTPYQAI
jgi:hypothetical protein